MASSYSTNLALELMATGDQSGTWGTTTNTNLGTLLEQAISGYVTQAITDGADTTITIPNGATGVARNMVIEMTGALTAARTLIVPSNKKLYFIFNNTTGGFAVTVKVTGLTGVSVPNGKKVLLASNGTDIVEQFNQVVGNLAVGGTLGVTGATTLTGVATMTAAPVFSSATASLPMFTDGSKALISNSMTGTGNVVMSASPTLTGTIAGASQTLSGTLGVTGVATLTAAPVFSSATASLPMFTDGSKALVSNAMTGTGSVVMSASPTLTGTIGAASQTLSGSLTVGTTLGVSGAATLSSTLGVTGAATLSSTLGVTGVATFAADPLFNSTGAILVSKGNTAARPIAPTLASGMFRFNTTSLEFEGYNGTAWASVGGASITNDTTTATDIFPLSASATTGTASTVFTSNAKLLYKPSTGDFQASQLVASNGLFVNKTTVAANYTIASGFNAMSVGPVTISSGISVTISSGQRWLVL